MPIVTTAPIAALVAHPRNPRRGDLEAIKESLRHHGQYRPIVANQRTGEVLAGNHVFRAASEVGWAEIDVSFVDVSDDEATRIERFPRRPPQGCTGELG